MSTDRVLITLFNVLALTPHVGHAVGHIADTLPITTCTRSLRPS